MSQARHEFPAELDAEPAEAFAARMAPLFEGAPRFLASLAAARPFGSWAALFDAARPIAHALSEAARIELVNAHPRLGAPREVVSALSFREQGYDRPPVSREPLGRDLAVTLQRGNDAYEARFGFRYCVFVAGRPLAELLPALEAALDEDRATELSRALDAVIDIAHARQEAFDDV